MSKFVDNQETDEIKKETEKEQYILVQVNMTEEMLHKIDEVKKRVHAGNKTTAIRYSIEIADMITDVVSRGGRVFLEDDGRKYIMRFPGWG